jgi:hypothetical protein
MDSIIPCGGSLGIVFLILGFGVVMRFINYKETMALAEKGLVKPARFNGNGKGALIWGVIITAIGLAFIIGLWPLGAMMNTNIPFGFGPWMLAGLIPTFFGLALILIHMLTREDKKEEQSPPGTGAKTE